MCYFETLLLLRPSCDYLAPTQKIYLYWLLDEQTNIVQKDLFC